MVNIFLLNVSLKIFLSTNIDKDPLWKFWENFLNKWHLHEVNLWGRPIMSYELRRCHWYTACVYYGAWKKVILKGSLSKHLVGQFGESPIMSSSALTEGGLLPTQSVSLIVAPSPLSRDNAQKMHPGNFGHLKNPHRISDFLLENLKL